MGKPWFVKPHHRQQIFAFAFILIVQFAASPACCLQSYASGLHTSLHRPSLTHGLVYLHGDPNTPDQSSSPMDHLCAACHMLGDAGLVPTGATAPVPVAWVMALPRAPAKTSPATPAAALSFQARAPPHRT